MSEFKFVNSSRTANSLQNVNGHHPVTKDACANYNFCNGSVGTLNEYSWRNIEAYTGSISRSNNVSQFSEKLRFKVSPIAVRGGAVGKLQVLSNVSCRAQAGRFLAIIGASGSGKTTLLNVVAHSTDLDSSGLQVNGDFFVNGLKSDANEIRTISAYVQQQDLFLAFLTVKEHLQFQAMLMMPKSSRQMREHSINKVLREIGLEKCQGNLIGMPGNRGISGGERKRLSIATQMLNSPSILFLDEPTSGLDSFLAEQVISCLKKSLASHGLMIICTIHQPSSAIFSMFDDLLILVEGCAAYWGPAADAVNFFSRLGFPCPSNYNPADHFAKTMAIVAGKEHECRIRATRFQKFCRVCLKETEEVNCSSTGSFQKTHANGSDMVPVSATKMHKKQDFLSIAFMVGIGFFQTPICCKTVQNINGLLFLLIIHMTIPYIYPAATVFCLEFPTFMREQRANLYKPSVYFLAKLLGELPQYTIFPMIYVTIIYGLTGLRAELSAFLTTALIILLVANISTGFGHLASVISLGNVDRALATVPIVVIPFMLFGGFFLNKESVPFYFIGLQHLSFYKYAYEALATNEWRGIETIPLCDMPSNTTCWRNGDEVLTELLSFDEVSISWNVFFLVGLLLLLRILAYAVLKLRIGSRFSHSKFSCCGLFSR